MLRIQSVCNKPFLEALFMPTLMWDLTIHDNNAVLADDPVIASGTIDPRFARSMNCNCEIGPFTRWNLGMTVFLFECFQFFAMFVPRKKLEAFLAWLGGNARCISTSARLDQDDAGSHDALLALARRGLARSCRNAEFTHSRMKL